MARVVIFGCSLTHRPGIQEGLQKKYNCEVKKYAISAGGNDIQMSMFDSYLLNDYRHDDIILWQVTHIMRRSGSTIQEHEWAKKLCPYVNDYKFNGSSKKVRYEKQNYFDKNLDRIYHLSNDIFINKYQKNLPPVGGDVYETIQNLAAKFIMLSRFTDRYFIYKGWSGVLVDMVDTDYSLQFKSLMEEWNVNYTELNPYVDFCINNNLEMDEDGFHPMKSSGETYVNRILHKKIGHFFS